MTADELAMTEVILLKKLVKLHIEEIVDVEGDEEDRKQWEAIFKKLDIMLNGDCKQ